MIMFIIIILLSIIAFILSIISFGKYKNESFADSVCGDISSVGGNADIGDACYDLNTNKDYCNPKFNEYNLFKICKPGLTCVNQKCSKKNKEFICKKCKEYSPPSRLVKL
jgi:hypothetical protein